MGYDREFGKITSCLRQALEATTIEESQPLISEAIKRTEGLSNIVATAAVKRGRKGGKKTAQRGPEYFRKIAAMRKTKAGGRPNKKSESN